MSFHLILDSILDFTLVVERSNIWKSLKSELRTPNRRWHIWAALGNAGRRTEVANFLSNLWPMAADNQNIKLATKTIQSTSNRPTDPLFGKSSTFHQTGFQIRLMYTYVHLPSPDCFELLTACLSLKGDLGWVGCEWVAPLGACQFSGYSGWQWQSHGKMFCLFCPLCHSAARISVQILNWSCSNN